MTSRIADTLGPAVLPDFDNVVGLDELAKKGRQPLAPQPKVTAPEKPALGKDVWRQTVRQLDTSFSVIAAIPTVDSLATLEGSPVPADYMEQVADGMYPLAAYYSDREPTVTTLWVMAGLSFLGYAALKMQQFRAVQLQRKREAQDGHETDQETAGKGKKR